MNTSLRWAVLERDSFTCVYCGRRPPDVVLHVDHKHPRSKGGEDTFENLVTACQDCNLGKATRDSRAAISIVDRLARAEQDAQTWQDAGLEEYLRVTRLEREMEDLRDQLRDQAAVAESLRGHRATSIPMSVAEILDELAKKRGT